MKINLRKDARVDQRIAYVEPVVGNSSSVRILNSSEELRAALDRAAMFERVISLRISDRLNGYESHRGFAVTSRNIREESAGPIQAKAVAWLSETRSAGSKASSGHVFG
jgi:hypothetical protein